MELDLETVISLSHNTFNGVIYNINLSGSLSKLTGIRLHSKSKAFLLIYDLIYRKRNTKRAVSIDRFSQMDGKF